MTNLSLSTDHVRCGCGELLGGRGCGWTGPAAEAVVLEYMPRSLRSSHDAAGNAGLWPHNGAERAMVERGCAECIVDAEDGWASIVEGGAR
jgi:hypothetical protein